MAPRLYLPLRSSTSRPPPAAAPTFAAPPTSSRLTSRHVPGASAPLPAFHSSTNSLVAATAAQPIRPTQVTTQIHPRAEARLHGTSALNYSSSGSLHHHDPGSVCLSAMVHEFLEIEEEEEEEEEGVRIISSPACGRARCNCADGVCGDETCAAIEPEEDAEAQIEHLCEILEGYTSCTSKAELHLLMEVGKAMEEMAAEEIIGSRKLCRPIMRRLREMEYNAAACKSRWNHGDGLPAGAYEYIDVIMEGKDGKEERIIVDIDFKAQFEIARPSIEYARLLKVVPKVFVGRAERVKQVVKTMSRAAKRSLQAQGLLLPPWRKSKYMRAKWLSPIYRRTTNIESTKQYVRLEINRQDEEELMRMKNVDTTRASGKRQLMSENSEIRDIEDDEGRTNYKREGSKEKVVKRGFEASELHKKRPGFLNSTREVCTAMCTSWQLPSLEDKSLMAPRVSALSIALKQQQRNPSTIIVVS